MVVALSEAALILEKKRIRACRLIIPHCSHMTDSYVTFQKVVVTNVYPELRSRMERNLHL